MAGEWLNDVEVTFVKAYSGPDVLVEEKQGKDGPYKKYIFNAQFKDDKGEVKKHKTHSFKPPASVGEVLVGDIKLYRGNGPKGTYTSYTFYPKDGVVAKAAPEQAQETPPPATQSPNTVIPPKRIPLEHRQYAVQKLLRMAYDTTLAVREQILEDAAEADNLPYAEATLKGSFTEIWKCAIMSLKLDGQVWVDIMATAGDEYAEKMGMPTDAEIEAALPDEKVQKLVEKTEGTVEDTRKTVEERHPGGVKESDSLPF